MRAGTSYDISDCIRMAQMELTQAENKLNNVAGPDIDVAIAEYNAKLAKLNRLIQIAKEGEHDRRGGKN